MMNLTMQVPSLSNPQVTYSITRHASTRAWSCSCPAWRFQHKASDARSCKHIKAVALDLAVHVADRAGVKV